MMTSQTLVFSLTNCVFLAACVSAKDPTPGGTDQGGAAGAGAANQPQAGQGGTPPVGTGGHAGATGDTGGMGGAGGGPDSCETGTAGARLQPANLIVLFDRTGSMGDGDNYMPERRWDPTRDGFLAFVDDPQSSQLFASLDFFPVDGNLETVCTLDNYQSPDVELTSLADGSAFHAAFGSLSPAGGSPTLPAMQGAHLYALSVALDHPGEETAVVLVTDGQPQFWNSITQQYEPGCQDNGFSRVASVAYSAFLGTPSVRTHVIGISNDADSPTLQEDLDVVAEAGATTPAQMVRDADPSNSPVVSQAAVATSTRRALEQIRDDLITCDVPLPTPPSEQSLVPDQLNLSYVTANNFRNVLPYSADCADGSGWRYDNLAAPTKIELCSDSCDTVRTTAGSLLEAAFGCVTEGLGGEGGAGGQEGQGGQAPVAGGAGGDGGAVPVGGTTGSGGATSGGAPATAGSAGAPATAGSAGAPPATAGSAGASNPSLGGTTGSAGVPGTAGTSNAGAGG